MYAVSTLPYLYHLVTGQWPFILRELHEKYGSAVRFTSNDVSFITPSAWQKIYGYKKGGQPTFDKDRRLYRGSLTGADNILVADDADHSKMRRQLAHAFSEKALRGQEDFLKKYVDLLIMRLKAESAEGRSVDLVRWYNFMTFDVLGDLAFGESFGGLESGGYHPWVAMIFGGFKLATYNQALKRLPQIAPLLRPLLPKALLKNMQEHFQMSFSKARSRAESGQTDRKDFLSYILAAEDDKGMTSDEMGENSNVLIVAGSETTATLLSGTTFWLLKNPETYAKLTHEIRSTFRNEEDITMVSVNKCRYLLAVLNEGLRIYPPVPSGLGRICPEGGDIVDGYGVPEKVGASCPCKFRGPKTLADIGTQTVVSVPHWAAYHSTRNWIDPDGFHPERWLDEPRFAHDVKDVLQPFSFGPRACLGKK